MKINKKFYVYVLITTALLALIAWFFRFSIAAMVINSSGYDEKIEYHRKGLIEKLDLYYPQMVEDAKVAKSVTILNPTYPLTRDASEFLNPLVGWDSGVESKDSHALAVGEELKAILQSTKWLETKIDLSKYKIDFSWFSKLHEFDHWNYTRRGPYYEENAVFDPAHAPLPNYSEFILWTKLYLLHSRDSKALDKASLDIDHLVHILRTNENLVSMAVAMRILKFKRDVFETLSPIRQKKLKGVFLSEIQNKQILRVMWARGIMQIFNMEGEFLDKLEALGVARCLSFEENVSSLLKYKHLLELAYPEQLQRFSDDLELSKSECPESYVKRMWTSKDYRSNLLKNVNLLDPVNHNSTDGVSSQLFKPTMEQLQTNPRLAKAYMGLILSIGGPDPFAHYGEDSQ